MVQLDRRSQCVLIYSCYDTDMRYDSLCRWDTFQPSRHTGCTSDSGHRVQTLHWQDCHTKSRDLHMYRAKITCKVAAQLQLTHLLVAMHPCMFCTNQQHLHHLLVQVLSCKVVQQLEILGCHFPLEVYLEPVAQQHSHFFQDFLEVGISLSILHVHTFSKIVMQAKKNVPSKLGRDKVCVGPGTLGEPDEVDCAVGQSKIESCTKVLVPIAALHIQSDATSGLHIWVCHASTLDGLALIDYYLSDLLPSRFLSVVFRKLCSS